MARKSFDDRREEILRAALTVIARRGFAATTTREVTTEVGVTHGLLHHYFPSRDDLLAAAFDLAAEEDLAHLAEVVAEGTDPLDRLRRYLRYYGPTSDDPMVRLWIDAWSEAPRNESLATTSRRQNRAWHAILRDLLTEGTEAGVFGCPDPDDAAWVVIAILDGLALQRVVARAVTARQVRAGAHRVIERELDLTPGSLT